VRWPGTAAGRGTTQRRGPDGPAKRYPTDYPTILHGSLVVLFLQLSN
jgi:hypothetical protein